MIELTIIGELASKSNSRRLVLRGKHPRIIKSEKALNYEQSAMLQIKMQRGLPETLEGAISAEFHVYYASRRPDLDVSLIQDVLQKAGIYKNDRQIVELHAFKYIDKNNPRVLIKINEVDDPLV